MVLGDVAEYPLRVGEFQQLADEASHPCVNSQQCGTVQEVVGLEVAQKARCFSFGKTCPTDAVGPVGYQAHATLHRTQVEEERSPLCLEEVRDLFYYLRVSLVFLHPVWQGQDASL